MGSAAVALPQVPPGRPGWWRTIGAVFVAAVAFFAVWVVTVIASAAMPGNLIDVVSRLNGGSGSAFPGQPWATAAEAVFLAALLTGPLVWALEWRIEERPALLWTFAAALAGALCTAFGDSDGAGGGFVVTVIVLRQFAYLADGRPRPSPLSGRTAAELIVALAVVGLVTVYGAAANRPLIAQDYGEPVDVRQRGADRLTAEVSVENHGPHAVVVQGHRIGPGVSSGFTVRLQGTCAGIAEDGLRLPYTTADGARRSVRFDRTSCSWTQ